MRKILKQFSDRNSDWILDESEGGQEIREFARQLDQELAWRNMPISEHLAEVERKVREKIKAESDSLEMTLWKAKRGML